MEETNRRDHKITYYILIVLLGIAAPIACAYIYGKDLYTSIGCGIIIGALALLLILVCERDIISESLLFDNALKLDRFFIVYFIVFALCLFFPFIPIAGWPMLVVFVLLALLSSVNIGFLSGLMFLLMSFMLSDTTAYIYLFIYIAVGICGIFLFETFSKKYGIIRPLLISVALLFVLLSVSNVLIVNRAFSPSLFILPGINVLISFILLLVVLKLTSLSENNSEADRFMDILDPESELLSELKATSKEDFDHSVYVSVLCSRVAAFTDIDENKVKALAYYHRIGALRGANTWENASAIMQEHNIPEEIIELLSEYIPKDGCIKAPECAVLYFADTIVSSIRYLFKKDPDAKLDYIKLIDAVFDKKIESGVLKECSISYKDIETMKNVLKEQQVFYDFLK